MKIPQNPARSLRRFLAQRPEARRFAARAWLGAPAVQLSLALLGLRTTLRWIDRGRIMERASSGALGQEVGVEEGKSLVEGVYRAHFLEGQCLPRSLLQHWLHVRDGTSSRFVLGVRKADDALEAHAWVESALDPDSSPPREIDGFSPLLARGAA